MTEQNPDKNIEQEMFKDPEAYKSLVENVNIGIFQTTVDGRLIQANNSFVRILGYKSMKEIINMPVQNLYKDPKDRERFISILKTQGQISNFEVFSTKADNSIAWGSLSAAYVRGKGSSEPTIWGSLIDISDQTSSNIIQVNRYLFPGINCKVQCGILAGRIRIHRQINFVSLLSINRNWSKLP